MAHGNSIVILMADDDADDRLLTHRALGQSRVVNDMRFVEDGEELMEYLLLEGRYSDSPNAPSPGLILLDLNMPRKDGREALHSRRTAEELPREHKIRRFASGIQRAD